MLKWTDLLLEQSSLLKFIVISCLLNIFAIQFDMSPNEFLSFLLKPKEVFLPSRCPASNSQYPSCFSFTLSIIQQHPLLVFPSKYTQNLTITSTAIILDQVYLLYGFTPTTSYLFYLLPLLPLHNLFSIQEPEQSSEIFTSCLKPFKCHSLPKTWKRPLENLTKQVPSSCLTSHHVSLALVHPGLTPLALLFLSYIRHHHTSGCLQQRGKLSWPSALLAALQSS